MNSKHRTFSSSKKQASHSYVVSKYCSLPLQVSTCTIKASVGHIQFADMLHSNRHVAHAASDFHTCDKRYEGGGERKVKS